MNTEPTNDSQPPPAPETRGPGWYPNPDDPTSSKYRYWTGTEWARKGPRSRAFPWVRALVITAITAAALVVLPTILIAAAYLILVFQCPPGDYAQGC